MREELKFYKRIFCELRFPVQIKLLDDKSKILELFWKEILPHWRVEQNFSIKFHNNDFTETFVVEPKRIAFDVEAPSTENYFTDRFFKILKIFSKLVKVDKFIRLGVRSYNCISPLNFTQFIKQCNRGLIFNSNLLKAIDPSYNFNDFSIILENENSRIVYGPMKKNENHQYLENLKNFKGFDSDFLFFDVDVFKKNIELKKLNTNFTLIVNKINSYSKNIFDYCQKGEI